MIDSYFLMHKNKNQTIVCELFGMCLAENPLLHLSFFKYLIGQMGYKK